MRVHFVYLLTLLALTSPLAAHGLKVFADAEGKEIKGMVYFVGGGTAQNLEVRLLDGSDKELARAKTDANGDFGFALPANATALRILVSTPDGHRAEYKLTTSAPAASDGDALLAAADDQPTAAQLAVLRQQLVDQQRRIRVRDILGGIGYIVGILGLIAWFKKGRATA